MNKVTKIVLTIAYVLILGYAFCLPRHLFSSPCSATVLGKDGELLGAHMVGANVSEMVGGIVTARNLGVKASDIMTSVFPHPSMSEAIMEAAAALHGEAIHI